MYGPPGRLYVYRIHGHHCANVVTGPAGEGSAVLLRAARIVDGAEAARARRGERRTGFIDDAALARGPGNLCRALGITMADLDTALEEPSAGQVRLGDPTTRDPTPPGVIGAGPRVGVRQAADVAWRFWITDDPTVSAYRRHPKAQPTVGPNQ